MKSQRLHTKSKRKNFSTLNQENRIVQAKANSNGIKENNGFQKSLNHVLNQNGEPMTGEEKNFFESRFGHNFSQVRIHDQDQASVAAKQINALAFTVGNDIVLENGQQNPMARKELLAHELTHVIQQTKQSGGRDSVSSTENEADRNSRKIAGGGPLKVNSSAPSGNIQRQPKGKVSIENSGTKKDKDEEPSKAENKFTFSAEAKVPVPGHPGYGQLSLIDSLDLNISGEKGGEDPISAPVDLETLKLKVALQLAKIELEKVKNTRIGKFSLGTKMGTDTSLTLKLGKDSGVEGEIGTSFGFDAGYKSPNLIPGRFGSLGAELKLGGKESLTTSIEDKSKFTPKFSATGSAGLKYTSPSFSGGLLGEKATVDIGAGASASASYSPEKTNIKRGLSGEAGVTGKTKSGKEKFIKLKITGDVSLDQKAGEVRSHTNSVMIGGFVGGSF